MLILAIFFKTALLLGLMGGAGLAIARTTMPVHDVWKQNRLRSVQRLGLVLALVGAAGGVFVLALRLGAADDPGLWLLAASSPPARAATLVVVGAGLGLAVLRLDLAGAVLMVLASGISGHASVVSPICAALIVIHLAAACWWTGGLLLLLESVGQGARFTDLLRRFSGLAPAAILALVAAAGLAVVLLLGASILSVHSGYIRLLVFKLVLVVVALAIALWNRVHLTTRVYKGDPVAVRVLHKTMRVELVLIAAATIAAGALSTGLAPPSHHTALTDTSQFASREDLRIRSPVIRVHQ